MALTQSAVSRQIQSLEDEVGVRLFLRHTRAVELTGAGAQLLAAVPSPCRASTARCGRSARAPAGSTVALTTFASFASMWLIPRMEQFQRDHPDIDIRIDASDAPLDLEVADVDLALAPRPGAAMPPGAIRLFGETLTPVASPWLLKSGRAAAEPGRPGAVRADRGRPHDAPGMAHLARAGSTSTASPTLQPKRWLYFNYSYQMVQAALAGQGIVLARLPLVAESLANGDLVEASAGTARRLALAYWLMAGPRSAQRPEIGAFSEWLLAQGGTRRPSARRRPGDRPELLSESARPRRCR